MAFWSNGGKIVVGATGNPVLCDTCPCDTIGGECCGDAVSRYWQFTLSGVVDSAIDPCSDCATVFNTTFCLQWVGNCVWMSHTFSWCGPGPTSNRYHWKLECLGEPINTYRLILNEDDDDDSWGEAWIIDKDLFDTLGSNTMTYTGPLPPDSDTCIFPETIVVSPAGDCDGISDTTEGCGQCGVASAQYMIELEPPSIPSVIGSQGDCSLCSDLNGEIYFRYTSGCTWTSQSFFQPCDPDETATFEWTLSYDVANSRWKVEGVFTVGETGTIRWVSTETWDCLSELELTLDTSDIGTVTCSPWPETITVYPI